eukprot:5048058-Pleurochrysis_carterae.AAC.1
MHGCTPCADQQRSGDGPAEAQHGCPPAGLARLWPTSSRAIRAHWFAVPSQLRTVPHVSQCTYVLFTTCWMLPQDLQLSGLEATANKTKQPG